MSYTRAQWATALLMSIGNSNPTPQIVEWLVGWTNLETSSPPGAAYNLLNTTEPNTPGVVSNFNSAGVKNYDNFSDGIKANAKVLSNGFYPDIYNALRINNIAFLIQNAVFVNAQLSKWGTGAVFTEIKQVMGQNMSQSFPGTATIIVDNATPLAVLEYQAVVKAGYDTGIGIAWMNEYAAGNFHGPALCIEYTVGNFAYQHFAGATAVWDHTLHKVVEWRKYS